MIIPDLFCVRVTPEMTEEAERVADQRVVNKGNKTREAFDNRWLGDVVGDLAHQAVDFAFDTAGVPFESFRDDKTFGDLFDQKYEDDLIDTKGKRGDPHSKYFYNEHFLVFADQVEEIRKGKKKLTHFCFTLVSHDLDHVCIYGVIRVSDFINVAKPVKIRYDNFGIRGWEVLKHGKSFRNYVFRI